jgi:hypothetical protein
MRKFDESDFDILIGSPHDEVIKILRQQGIVKENGGGVRYDDIRQYVFTDRVRDREYLINFKIGGDRALDSIVVNIP